MKQLLVGLSAGAILVGGVVGTVGSQRVSAQGEGIPTVLQAILDLGNAVVGLQTTMNFVQKRVETLAPPFADNVRFTPPVSIGELDGIRCVVANVDDASHQIKTEQVDGSGRVVLANTLTLPAGGTTYFSQILRVDAYYCRFTVLDGVKGDIRGALQTLVGGGANLIVAAE